MALSLRSSISNGSLAASRPDCSVPRLARVQSTYTVRHCRPCSLTKDARHWGTTASSRLAGVRVHAAAPEASGAPAGQVTAELVEQMRKKISEALETDAVVIADVYGDGRHVSIDVMSDLFEGKNAVQRQRMVYKAIWEELQGAVHAVDAMTTKTRKEVDAQPIRS